MIKPEELRLNNWVFIDHPDHEGNVLCQVRSIDTLDVWLDIFEDINDFSGVQQVSISRLKGIPLTPEWLERFGFKKMDQSEYTLDTYELDGIRVWIKDRNYFLVETHPSVRVEYAHQLQNLYFALTGKELELKQ